GTPSGTVTVNDGNGGTCSATLPATSCSLASTSAGTKTLTANYGGDSNFKTSSGTAAHTVNKADTTTAISLVSPEPSVVGQSYTVTFGVTVNAPGAGTPGGTVTVNDGNGGTCSATLPATSCSLASTSAGPKTLTASYGGDSNFNTSSGTASHTVNTRATMTQVTLGSTTIAEGSGTTVMVTVTDIEIAGTAITPTGLVAFSSTPSS